MYALYSDRRQKNICGLTSSLSERAQVSGVSKQPHLCTVQNRCNYGLCHCWKDWLLSLKTKWDVSVMLLIMGAGLRFHMCASLSLSLSVSFGLSLPFLLTVIGTLVTPQLLQICVTFHDMQTYLMLSSHLWLEPFLWAVIDDCSTKRLAICPSVHPSVHLSIYLSVYCLSVLSVYALTVFLKCFGTFFETVLTFSKLWEQMSQLFAGTSELDFLFYLLRRVNSIQKKSIWTFVFVQYIYYCTNVLHVKWNLACPITVHFIFLMLPQIHKNTK